MKNKKVGKSLKIGIAAAVAVAVAGISVYATSVSANAGISEEEAKQIALSEVKGADVSNITKFREDQDDGRKEYDIEIIYDGYEYDFEISAEDGTIFDRSKEKSDTHEQAKAPAENSSYSSENENSSSSSGAAPTHSNSSSSEISLESAKEIALAQVSGATAGNIVKAEKDYDDGYTEYEIEILYNGYEYDFEISAETGEIISKDVEREND